MATGRIPWLRGSHPSLYWKCKLITKLYDHCTLITRLVIVPLFTKLCTLVFESVHFLSFNKQSLYRAITAIHLFDRVAPLETVLENIAHLDNPGCAAIQPLLAWETHLFFHEFNSTRNHIILARPHYNQNSSLERSYFTLVIQLQSTHFQYCETEKLKNIT